MEKDNKKYALIFGGLQVSDEERFRVGQEITKLGGLTFSEINKSKDGWFTKCDQLEGIIAGSKNPEPTSAEIEDEIRQAIISAFNVQIQAVPQESPFKFEYGFVGGQ
ncbi:MAG: hypothetical protein AAB726_01385 [Patescibacteria group bacterium]